VGDRDGDANGVRVGSVLDNGVAALVGTDVNGRDVGIGIAVGVDKLDAELVGETVGALNGPALGVLLGVGELREAVGLVGTVVGAIEQDPHMRAQFRRIQSVLHAISTLADPGVKLLQAHSSRSLHSAGAMIGLVVGLNDGPQLGSSDGARVGDRDGDANGVRVGSVAEGSIVGADVGS